MAKTNKRYEVVEGFALVSFLVALFLFRHEVAGFFSLFGSQ
jgi:hypothetical protein